MRPDRAAKQTVGALLGVAVILSLGLATGLAHAEPADDGLSAREIYASFLSNRHRSAIMRMTVLSRGGESTSQEAELFVRFQDLREGNARPPDGDVISKTFVRVERPEANRRLTYLVVGRANRPRDEFVFIPETRKTRRIRLRGFGLLGTRVTVDDLLFQSLDDATYTRLPDTTVAGVPAYVVRAVQAPHMRTEYRRTLAYIAKETFVLMRALYRDDSGVTLREMRANPESIQRDEGIWLAREITIFDPLTDSSSILSIDTLAANAALPERAFSAYELWHRRD